MYAYTESGLKLSGLDLASLVTQGVCAGAQPNAYTGYGIIPLFSIFSLFSSKLLQTDADNMGESPSLRRMPVKF